MKLNFKIYGAVSTLVIGLFAMSCEDHLTDISSNDQTIQATSPNTKTELQANDAPRTEFDIKSVKLDGRDVEEIQAILKEVDPSLYHIEVQEHGKIIDRIGSAEINDLQKVGAYFSKDFGGRVAANEIITTVGDYIKTIWTAKLLESGKYAQLVQRVESILNKNVVHDIALEKAKLVSEDLRNIQKALANVDPSLYQIEVQKGGKIIDRIGSGEISDLRRVGAYFSPRFKGNFAGNEIITTVGDYIKTIWTAKLLESGRYLEEIKYVEGILNNASIR